MKPDVGYLIDQLYGSMSLLELRTNFLKLVLPILKADGAAFFLTDKNYQTLDLNNGVFNGLDSGEYLKKYKEYYKNLEPFRELIFSNILCATEKMLPQSWMKSKECREYQADFSAPQKLQHELMICIRSENKLFGKVGVFKRINRPDFSKRDIEISILFAKHLQYVIKNMALATTLQNNIDTTEDLFEFPSMGVITLDYSLRVIKMNEMAKRICDKIWNQRPTSILGNVEILLPLEIISDCQKLKQRFTESKIAHPSFPIINNIDSNNHNRFISRSYFNVNTTCKEDAPSFFILLEDSKVNDKIREQSAASKYKLSPREIQICTAIKEGFTNREIADKFFVNLSTIETHISNIFEKTEAKNRTDLVKLFNFE